MVNAAIGPSPGTSGAVAAGRPGIPFLNSPFPRFSIPRNPCASLPRAQASHRGLDRAGRGGGRRAPRPGAVRPDDRAQDLRLADARGGRPAPARRDIVLVAIDEPSIRQLEPAGRPLAVAAPGACAAARLPGPRAPAKVVVYDVMFAERDRDSFDRRGGVDRRGIGPRAGRRDGARGQRRARRHAAARGSVTARRGRCPSPVARRPYRGLDHSFEERPVVEPPFPELAKASRALGHNLLVSIRTARCAARCRSSARAGQFIPSLPRGRG